MPGFIENSTVTSNTIKQGVSAITRAQSSVSSLLPSPSKNVSDSVFGTVTHTLSGSNQGISKGITTVNQTVNTVGNVLRAADSTQRYIQSALRSITSTFGSSKSLASDISGKFNTSFADSTVKKASTTTTKISDSVNTNLLKSKPPASSAFKVGSLETGSQAITMSGSSGTFGTGAALMTGTAQSTLINRFSLDSDKNLGSSANNAFSKNKLNGLFSSVRSVATDIKTVANTVRAEVNAAQRVVYSVKQEYAAISGVVSQAQRAAESLTSISSLNDINQFAGDISGLGRALGGAELSTYYMVNSVDSLVDLTGAIVGTNQSGVDAVTANGILDIMRKSGCYNLDESYRSASGLASLFNLGLGMAARYGMDREVSSLLACSQTSTVLGQRALSNAFSGSAGTQLSTANTILQSISSPAQLKTDTLTKSILTNSKLKSSSKATVESIFQTLGTTTKKELSVPSASSNDYPVFDLSLLTDVQPGFVNAVFLDTTLTDYLNGYPLSVQSDGRFTPTIV